VAEIEVEKYKDIDEQYREILAETRETRPSSNEMVRKNGYNLRHYLEIKKAILAKVTQIETSIKKLDPNYQSIIVATKYPHVGRSN